MRVLRIRLAALALVSGIALSGCAYDMYGDPYGYGYGPSGGVSVGVGYGGGYGGYYGYGYPYGGYGYGYDGYYDPFGWYGDYYYPGVGIYVYDRDRHRHEWTDDQRRYWGNRHQQWQGHNGTATVTGTAENWSGWDRSHWHDRGTTSTNTGGWTRGNWQGRTSVTTSGERAHGSEGGHHSREQSNARPQ